ncbi:hypothetical protein [Legionella fallonii]|uniref:Uncharacterized protein n=1 Tax=Legionella fallonii LLAP-10 TaxID=1212491 RepID=A0A098G7F7_9GAMM|nr:hypothetical protein [Legionella fallonii]CEG57445.1 conserved protein of unknown function [Legionella fallonii LLAP-10]
MNKEFKKLLLKIAQLSLKDQNWILNQLSPRQQKQFVQQQGIVLLDKARKFRKLPLSQLPLATHAPQLPDVCSGLMRLEPFYIAIILEQGNFSWTQHFLRSNEQGEQIKRLIEEVVCMLKPATKAHAFQQWQRELSFKEQLEHLHD